MPESPRWLIAHNRRKEAKILIEKAFKKTSNVTVTTESTFSTLEEDFKNLDDSIPTIETTKNRLRNDIRDFQVLVSNSELRNRLLITNFNWMVASLCYYALGNQTIIF